MIISILSSKNRNRLLTLPYIPTCKSITYLHSFTFSLPPLIHDPRPSHLVLICPSSPSLLPSSISFLPDHLINQLINNENFPSIYSFKNYLSLTLHFPVPLRSKPSSKRCLLSLHFTCVSNPLWLSPLLQRWCSERSPMYSTFLVYLTSTQLKYFLHLTSGTFDGLIFFLAHQLFFLSVLSWFLFYYSTHCSFLWSHLLFNPVI